MSGTARATMGSGCFRHLYNRFVPEPDIERLRRERPEVDAALSEMESDGRSRLARTGMTGYWCFRVLIAHEGEEALALTSPGRTVRQCSRGKQCRGCRLPHAQSNVSCRLVLAPCPWCDLPEGDESEANAS
jgi:hypothetical protein